MSKKLVILLIVCLGLRLIGLDQSLWLDEAISANVAKDYSYGEIINSFSPSDFHPPLYYLTLKTWTNIFGWSEISLRMPSVIFSLITVYLVYLIGGIWPATITGLNPLLIYYSQEARMYSMVTMLLTMALYFLIKKKYWLVSLFLGISLLTFYGSIFFIGSIIIYLLVSKKIKELLIILIGPLMALGLVSQLLWQQYQNSREMLGIVTNWDLVLGKANLKNLLLIPMKFTSGRISFIPKIIYYLVAGLFSVLVFSKLIKRNIFSFVFWITLLIGITFSIFTPMLQYFRFLYLIPVMALMINKNKLVLMGFLIFSLIYLLNPRFYREDWKSLSRTLTDKVYMISSFGDPVKYYRPDIEIVDLREITLNPEITVIPYGATIHGIDVENKLTNLGYKKIDEVSFREISKQNWQLIP